MACGDDPAENLRSAVANIERAVEKKAQVICLPELFRSRYFCQTEDPAFFDLAESIPGTATETLAGVARKHGVAVVAPLFERRAPGLYHKERRVLGPIVAVTSFFFIGGALFGYFVVFPSGFKFLLSFGADFIRTLPSMREYLDFSTKLLFIFGLLFELPVALTGLARLGIVSVEYLKRNRKYAVILAFVAGAFLTPDVVSMILMALPLMVLYEIGILGAHFVCRKKGTPEASESHPA